MSLDGSFLSKLVQELDKECTTGRINKIYQTSVFDFLFVIHKQSKKQLLISVSPNYTRIHLTKYKKETLPTPPPFSMLLRKYLEGGIIKQISQVNNDRIVVIDIEKRDELGDLTIKKLIIEVTGRHSNLIVTDSNLKIIDAFKHQLNFESNQRTIYPNSIYTYLEDNKINPFDQDSLQTYINNKTEKNIVKDCSGISPLIAKEIEFRAANSSYNQAFNEVLHDHTYTYYQGIKDYFSYTTLTHLEIEPNIIYNKANELLDEYYLNRDTISIIKEKSKVIVKLINNQISKARNKIELLQRDLKKTEKIESIKQKGDLIQSNMYQINKGDTSVTCFDYYNNTEITIALDPKKSPIENMEQYYKKAKKIRNSIPHIEKQIVIAKNELLYFETLQIQLENASLKDVEEIKDELVSLKYLKEKKKQKKRNNKPNFTTYTTEENIEILVGKNNIQNEYITHKLAKYNHVWFHVKNATGSHVVVKDTPPLSEMSIRTAANLAAYYSKYQNSSSVAVDYTEIRNLKKVPGRLSSFVTYNTNKTIYIDPDIELINKLKQK